MVLKKLISEVDREFSQDIQKKREEFIRGGGMVIADLEKKKKSVEWCKFPLRITREAVDKIEDSLSKRLGGNRTTWILEAIQEKLQRESEG